jgi:hypothetical protein
MTGVALAEPSAGLRTPAALDAVAIEPAVVVQVAEAESAIGNRANMPIIHKTDKIRRIFNF